jgi:S-adenosylmethionine hydrolase
MIIGEVTYIDNFGNIISNINKDFLKILERIRKFHHKIQKFSPFKSFFQPYGSRFGLGKRNRIHGQSAAIFNDSQLLELTIYKGSKKNGAKSLFGMNVGENIYIEFS